MNCVHLRMPELAVVLEVLFLADARVQRLRVKVGLGVRDVGDAAGQGHQERGGRQLPEPPPGRLEVIPAVDSAALELKSSTTTEYEAYCHVKKKRRTNL